MFDEAPIEYSTFVPHIEKINFDLRVFHDLVLDPPMFLSPEQKANCNKAADEISYQLLQLQDENGKFKKPDYWSDLDRFGKNNPITRRREMMSILDIETQILREMGRPNYGKKSEYGLDGYIHGLRAIKFMFRKTHITPVLADITQLTFLNFTYMRTFLHLLGSMDAGKSSSTARLLFLFMKIDMPATFGIVSTPLVDSAQMTIWGDITELYTELCEFHPDPKKNDGESTIIFPGADVTPSSKFLSFGKTAKADKGGWISHRSLKKQGTGVGAKGLGNDPSQGHGIFVMDEVNKLEKFDFESDLANLSGQPYFQMHTTQNPIDEQDRGGMLSKPKPWGQWGYKSYKEVRDENAVIWPADKDSIAYRINGLDAVNMRVDKIVYPWQFNKYKHDKVVSQYGKDSIEYSSQVLGIYSGADMAVTLLPKTSVDKSRYDDELGVGYTINRVLGRVIFNDPAHTGMGDQAVIGTSFFCEATILNIDGSQEEKMLLVKDRDLESVKYQKSLVWTGDPHPSDNELEYYYHKLGGDFTNVSVGDPMSYEEQIAIRMLILADMTKCPRKNIGFDFSMRPNMIDAVRLIIGPEPVAFNYNTEPVGYTLRNGDNTAERFSKRAGRTDELLYLTAELFKAKQIRGKRAYLNTAINQLSQTRVLTDKPGQPAEKKPDFKARNGNTSPDERDTLAGEVGMAYLRGFRLEGYSVPKSQKKKAQVNSQAKKIRKRKRMKPKSLPR